MDKVAEILNRIDSGEKAVNIELRLDWSALPQADAEILLREARTRATVPGGNELLNLLFKYKSNEDFWFKAKVVATILQREDNPIEKRLNILKTMEITLSQIKKKYLDPVDQVQPDILRRYQMLEAAYFAFEGKACVDIGEISKARQKYQDAQIRYQNLGVVNGVAAVQVQLDSLKSSPAGETATPEKEEISHKAILKELDESQVLLKTSKAEYEQLALETRQMLAARKKLNDDIDHFTNMKAQLVQDVNQMRAELSANTARVQNDLEKATIIRDLRSQLGAEEVKVLVLQRQIIEQENNIAQLQAGLQQQSLIVDHPVEQSTELATNELGRLTGAIKQAREDLEYYQKQISPKQNELRELNEKIISLKTQLKPPVPFEKRKDGLIGSLPSWLE